MYLQKGERIEKLFWDSFLFIQNKKFFPYGLDAVLLADFVRVSSGAKGLDLGTGSGILPLLLLARERNLSIHAWEIQPNLVQLARRNVFLNNLGNNIRIIQGDYRVSEAKQKYDFIMANPPFYKKKDYRPSPNYVKALSCIEYGVELEQLLQTVQKNLKPQGSFYFIYPIDRCQEIESSLRKYGMHWIRKKQVELMKGQGAKLVLYEIQLGTVALFRKEEELLVSQARGVYTDEMARIIQGRETR